ncbi:LamG domain-containing protein [Vacuolonema iberomarrocanum]|uniref:LamG domain-containing protein n=1 Tax=Vacuolonema iberomarrocanum TaxID=3454632 RepID=UPI003F6DEB16
MAPAALETALNELSETKRFRMIVCHENDELRIFIEGAALPEKQKWVPKVRRLLGQVGLKTSHPIYIYGRKIGAILPQWQQRLAPNQSSSASQDSQSTEASPAQAQSSASASSEEPPSAEGTSQASPSAPSTPQEKSLSPKTDIRPSPNKPQRSQSPLSPNRRSQLTNSRSSTSRDKSFPTAVKWGAIAGGGMVFLFFAALGVRSLLLSPSSSNTPQPQEYALQFDGEDDIAIAAQGYLPAFTSTTGGFSVSSWVYPTEFTTYGRVVERSDNTLSDRFLFVIDHEERGIRLSLNGSYAIGVGLPLNEWSHVVGTYDGTYIRVYINGELKAETLYQGGIDLTTSELWIGNNRENSRPFAGSLKDIQLWQRALTDGEIQQAMQQTPSAETRGLLASWEFSEASEAVLTDQVSGIPLSLQVAPNPFSSTDGPQLIEAP